MSDARSTAVIGVFTDHAQAQRAYEELKRSGFADAQIGYVARNGAAGENESGILAHAGEGVAAGAVGGGALGTAWGLAVTAGLLPGIGPVIAAGALAAVLASAAAGAAVGGLAGLLIGLGVPEEEAGYYERQLEQGRTLITVQAGERNGEALAILRRCAESTRDFGARHDALAGTHA
jgi:hypothetical protein